MATIVAASAILLVEIFANRPIADTIARAQHDLRVAQAAAEAVLVESGSFAGADAGSLAVQRLDGGELTVVGPDDASAGLGEVSVFADGTWAAAVSARPNACFYLKLVVGRAEPLYGVGTRCTARARRSMLAIRAGDDRGRRGSSGIRSRRRGQRVAATEIRGWGSRRGRREPAGRGSGHDRRRLGRRAGPLGADEDDHGLRPAVAETLTRVGADHRDAAHEVRDHVRQRVDHAREVAHERRPEPDAGTVEPADPDPQHELADRRPARPSSSTK